MALDKAGLKSALEALFADMEKRDSDAKGDFAGGFADALDAFVKSGEIPPGLAVATPAGPGSTSAPGKLV